ncbi:MAG: hypothetical protein K2Y20_09850 [Sphingomonas sp.]|nr:hypothetical protein [Sphingomonas sp.]
MAQDSEQLPPDLAKAPEGRVPGAGCRVPGKPENCITGSRVNGPEIIDTYNIIYRQSGTRIRRNQLTDRCPALRDNDILVIESYGDQICKYDRFRVVNRNSGIPSAYCIWGDFPPYDKVKPAPKS